MLIQSKAEFHGELNEELQGLTLLLKEVEIPSGQPLPECIQTILFDYPAIAGDSTAHLPPSHLVNHRIDLTPRASLPNLAHYQLSPKEAEELQKQVQQLLRDSMIHTSIRFQISAPFLERVVEEDGYRLEIQFKLSPPN